MVVYWTWLQVVMEGTTQWERLCFFLGQCLLELCQFPRAVVTKHHKPGGFEQQTLIVSWFWRSEVCSRSGGSTTNLLKALGRIWSRPLLAPGSLRSSLLPVSLHMAFSPGRICVQIFPVYKDISNWNRPTLLQYDFILINYIRNNAIVK